MKIQIVDDNKNIHSLIITLLGKTRNQFVHCYDGKDSLEAYEKNMPDLVIMDIQMEEMDGIEASKILLAKYDNAKIIIVTQFHDQSIFEMLYSIGIKRILPKENLIKIKNLIAEII